MCKLIRRTLVSALTSAALLALSGCFCVANEAYVEKEVRMRAAFDMSCPQAQLRLIRLGEKAMGVTGCGKKTTYALSLCTSRSMCHVCTVTRDAELEKKP